MNSKAKRTRSHTLKLSRRLNKAQATELAKKVVKNFNAGVLSSIEHNSKVKFVYVTKVYNIIGSSPVFGHKQNNVNIYLETERVRAYDENGETKGFTYKPKYTIEVSQNKHTHL